MVSIFMQCLDSSRHCRPFISLCAVAVFLICSRSVHFIFLQSQLHRDFHFWFSLIHLFAFVHALDRLGILYGLITVAVLYATTCNMSRLGYDPTLFYQYGIACWSMMLIDSSWLLFVYPTGECGIIMVSVCHLNA